MKIIKLTFILFLFLITNSHSVTAQSFYNFENFLADSAFIQSNKIKSVTIRIPTLLDDTTNKQYLPYQKLCFNPMGKLSTYEFDFSEKNRENIDYIEHYYNDTTQIRYKSHRFRKAKSGNDRDTLREEIIYHYDEKNKLFFEEHHQMFISEFNEWTTGYEWYGDSLRVRYADQSKIDTLRFDEKGRITQYSERGWLYKIRYDSIGRRAQMAYFLLTGDDDRTGTHVGEFKFVYDNSGKLERIETIGREIVYTYDFMGLPLSSCIRDRKTGKMVGWQVMYEYDYRW